MFLKASMIFIVEFFQSGFFENHEMLQKHLDIFVTTYNYAKKLKTLNGLTPYEKVCLYLRSEEGKSSINARYKFVGPYTCLVG